jgi:Ca2+-binding EF-hand superfamily protein
MENFRAATRRAIDPQITEYREWYIKKYKDNDGRFPCKKMGIMLSRKEEHVDHIPPQTFDKIVRDFLKLNKLDISMVEFSGYGDREIVTEFKHDELKLIFATYHRQTAILRVISKVENLRQPKK